MSTNYSIACRDCKEMLEIGRRNVGHGERVWPTEELSEFLFKHRSDGGEPHALFFVDNDHEDLRHGRNGVRYLTHEESRLVLHKR